MNKNKNIIYQNSWGEVETMFGGKFMMVNVHISKERSETGNLRFYLKKLKQTNKNKTKQKTSETQRKQKEDKNYSENK